MKFTKIVLLSAFGVVLATIQMSSTSEVVAGEEESRVAEDAYANYQQYYQQYAEQQPQHQPQHQPQVNPNPFGIHGFGIQNKQDFTSDIKEMLGPEAGLIVGGAGLAVGLLGLIGLAMQNVEFRGVCSATKAVGDTSLTLSTATTTATAALIAAQLNLIENAFNDIATPSCTS